MWVYLWALYSIPLIHVSGFVPVPYCFDYYSFVYHTNLILKSGSKTTLALYILKLSLAIWGLLWFHTNFGTICSVKNAMGILIVIVLNMKITLGYMDILTMLILSLPWCICPFISVQFLLYLCYSFQ